MNRILAVSLLLLLFSAAATAQRRSRSYAYLDRVNSITMLERWQLQKDVLRFRAAQRQAERDGRVTPYERKKLQKLKRKTRRDAIRFRFNSRNRVI